MMMTRIKYSENKQTRMDKGAMIRWFLLRFYVMAPCLLLPLAKNSIYEVISTHSVLGEILN